ncbi:hypothetical protein D5086_024806 [Populus alba]|uniref:Uncharacterized protein n=1 Tax=Populus alba TaxID=43335 RepID=A0ACC4B6K4_POPAL
MDLQQTIVAPYAMDTSTLLVRPIALIGFAITLLVPGEASLRERNDPNVAEVLGKIERYNHLFGGNTSSLVQHSQLPARSLQIVVALIPSFREKGEEE